MTQNVIWKIENNIGHIIFNDPPSNKMNLEFFWNFKNIITKLLPQSNVKAVLIYGNGRHFSSGADLSDLFMNVKKNTIIKNNSIEKYPSFLSENIESMLFLDSLKIPVIAVIKGVCLGSAMELALFCHIRICTESAVLGLPETTFNLLPGCGGVSKLLSITGYSKALEIILSGKNIHTKDALQLGIIHKLVDKKIIMDYAVELAEKVSIGYDKDKTSSIIDNL